MTASQEDWGKVEYLAENEEYGTLDRCVLELRDTLAALSDRVQALEDAERRRSILPEADPELDAAVESELASIGEQQPAPVAGEGSLVKAVYAAIRSEAIRSEGPDNPGEARAAILAVANWLDRSASPVGRKAFEIVAEALRQEVES